MCEHRVRDYPQPAHSLATTAFDALSGKRWQWSGRHITPVFPVGIRQSTDHLYHIRHKKQRATAF